MVTPPTGLDLLEHLDADTGDPNAAVRAYAMLDVATRAARGYTRGRGFDEQAGTVAEDLAAAILTSAARSYLNPALQATASNCEHIGSYEAAWGEVTWDLNERLALDRWRQRVA
ncbi:MAG TPA: hypothetical protein VK923_04070 [Euzebyales bacterium]|nr:hypothetical protein [Euzebyales bacterium]